MDVWISEIIAKVVAASRRAWNVPVGLLSFNLVPRLLKPVVGAINRLSRLSAGESNSSRPLSPLNRGSSCTLFGGA